MFGPLLKSLFTKKPAPPPAPAADTRIAAGQAQRARYQGRYDKLRQELDQGAGPTLERWLELGHLGYELDRDAEAEHALRQALLLDPDDPVANCGLGMIVFTHGRHAESEAFLRRALIRAPNDRSARFALAMTLLGLGQYPEGYRLLAARRDGPTRLGAKIEPLPAWRGEPLVGKTLVLWSDWGGFGDEIAYIRYARAIRERYAQARIVAAVPRPLVRLFGAQPYIDEAVAVTDGASADYQCAMIEAVSVLGTTVATVPSWPHYLQAAAADLQFWQTQLAEEPRLKVGLVWSGGAGESDGVSTTSRLDKHLAAGDLAPLAGLEGAVLVSLQKGGHAGKLADLLPGVAVIDDTDALADFADTAALIRQLDLVVAVDTAVAHLAGALGQPTLLLLKKSGGYFWPEGRNDTPWYPSMRLLRQHAHGDWSQVMQRVHAVVTRMAAGTPWPACFDQA
jgi:tetratricopeptide (TPR) repeat protein